MNNYKKLAKDFHPDKGGDHDSMVVLNEFREKLPDEFLPKAMGMYSVAKMEELIKKFILAQKEGRMIKKFIGEITQGRVELEFNPRMNVLVGANGSGKTLLLKALKARADEIGVSRAFRDFSTKGHTDIESFEWLRRHQLEDLLGEIGEGRKRCWSSGQTRLLAFISFLLVHQDKDLILMDTPETGLHPRAQKQFLGIAVKICPKAQFVVATRVPAIIKKGWMDKVVDMTDLVQRNK